MTHVFHVEGVFLNIIQIVLKALLIGLFRARLTRPIIPANTKQLYRICTTSAQRLRCTNILCLLGLNH